VTNSTLRGLQPTKHEGYTVSNHSTAITGPSAAHNQRPGLMDMDLSPQGLADAPANEVDPDSLVYTGNS
jgi:hypothetical protein